MTEWSQPDQAERFVREYADPILAGVRRLLPGPLGRPGHLSGYFSHPAGRNTGPLTPPDHERAFILRLRHQRPARTFSKAAGSAAPPPWRRRSGWPPPAPGEEHEVWQAVRQLCRPRTASWMYLFYCEGYSL